MESSRFSEEKATNWREFLNLYHKLWSSEPSDTTRWIFRGQSKFDRALKSTLEREAERTELSLDRVPTVEEQLVTEFQRKVHHYLSNIPHIGDHAEWFSLMRHYGAPSRLLDWTYSPFIAAFFAVRGATFRQNKKTVDCAVWALDSYKYTGLQQLKRLGEEEVVEHFHISELRQGFEPKYTKRAQAACLQFMLEKPRRDLMIVNPFHASDRGTIQQGVHLMPCDVTVPFEENLAAYPKADDNLTKVKIVLDKKSRNEFLLHFHLVNLNEASLFPGLQGFAESLRTRMRPLATESSSGLPSLSRQRTR